MPVHHIVVATDESDAGRHAVHVAGNLAATLAARLTVLTAVPTAEPHPVRFAPFIPPADPAGEPEEFARLRECLGPDLPRPERIGLAAAYGLPGIEIARFAEERQADLLVLGRKRRPELERLAVGDTADAVARRSRIPCLFVPPEGRTPVRRVLAALDGTDRGLAVWTVARDLARGLGAAIQGVTVEPRIPSEPADLAAGLPGGRSTRLAQRLEAMTGGLARRGTGSRRRDFPPQPALIVRRGDPVEEILAQVTATGADLLALGYHRGGPPSLMLGTSVARRLVHLAPTATLTVPL
ncbi:MAG: universal stress protein [Gemmatimonadota bacterium]